MTAIAALADALHARLMTADPFAADLLGAPGYSHLVPDYSEAAEARLRSDLAALDAQAGEIVAEGLADRIALSMIRDTIARTLDDLALGTVGYLVSPLPITGLSAVLAVAAITDPVDDAAGEAYVQRLTALPFYFETLGERLRTGTGTGRTAVRLHVDQTLAQIDQYLSAGDQVLSAVPAPPGTDAELWRSRLTDLVDEDVMPAVRRLRDLIARVVAPAARPADEAGLGFLPGGAELYRIAIRLHTTLPLGVDQLHALGRDRIASLAAQMVDLASELWEPMSAAGVVARLRQTRPPIPGDQDAVMDQVRRVVARAEARAGEVLRDVDLPPCAVTAMPAHLAEAGMAPHYTVPADDGSRPGTYWFNASDPDVGAGWASEAITFHETVPGHHLQLAYQSHLAELTSLARYSLVTAHAEGWGLYAEELADEMGLYSSAEQRLGRLISASLRAARLVVDTGIHGYGWSRQEAIDVMMAAVPLPEAFLAAEVDRYIAMPGQALAYQVGQTEILRHRQRAREALGERMDLPAFHAAILGHGAVSMPVLAEVVDDFIDARR